jgi:hypothetical protein
MTEPGTKVYVQRETRPTATNAKKLSQVMAMTDAEVDALLAEPEPKQEKPK